MLHRRLIASLSGLDAQKGCTATGINTVSLMSILAACSFYRRCGFALGAWTMFYSNTSNRDEKALFRYMPYPL